MANNYSQPFHGFPLYPPQQMLQPPLNAHPEEQRGPPQPPSALPGINLAAYGQNSQQPPFPPAAWLTQFPYDPNVWPPFIQNGMIVPPPSFAGFPPPSLPHTPQNLASPGAFPPQIPPQLPAQHTIAASERIQDVMDSDREDGEVSEGDVSLRPPAGKVNGRACPEPPRSAPPPPARVEEAYNPNRPAAGQKKPQEPVQKAAHPANAPAPVDKMQKDRDDAKQFIKVLNSNNIGYHTLAKENLDVELLRGLYQSLNLPSEPAPISLPKANGAAQKWPTQAPVASPAVPPTPSAKAQQQKSMPAVKTNVAPVQSAKSAASPTAPGDRKDYVARLQAAKMAKLAGAAKSSPPQQAPPALPATPAPIVNTPQPATTPIAKEPVTEEQRARNTELIKQRLEALRAQKKPSVASINGTTPPAPLRKRPEQSRAAAEQATQPAPSSARAPDTSAYMPPFPGIPGLFMSNPPSYSNNNNPPVVSRVPPSIPQKRPAPPDTEVSTPQGSATPHTQPVRQSPRTHQEDAMITQVSDDESNGSDMDIDEDQSAPKPRATSPPSLHTQYPAPGIQSNLPSRSGSAKLASAMSTPGSQPPATVISEKALEDKEQQLVAMRAMLKKKFAEKREKDKAAAAAAAAATPPPLPQDVSTPLLPPQSSSHSKLPTQSVQTARAVHVQPSNASSATQHITVEPARDTKRLRRTEIQSRLPSLDAKIATNTSRMAQLAKEMEDLMAQNERITKDKAQLTQELENLGVDTEGVSHAELRAKKDEIEREKSPELETTSQGGELASQPSAGEAPSAPPTSSYELAPPVAPVEKPSEFTSLPAQAQVPNGYANLPGLGQAAPQRSETETRSQTPILDKLPKADDKSLLAPEPRSSTPQDLLRSRESDVHANVKEIAIPTNTVPSTRRSATPLDDEEDFYSPAPAAEMDLDIPTIVDAPPQSKMEAPSVAAESPSAEEGEVEMSESSEDEEEEYEPEEPTATTDTLVQEAQVLEVETTRSIATSQVSTEDEEAYEPPDIDQEMSDVQSGAAIAESNSGLPQVEAEDGAMDIATSSDESSDDSDSDEETSPEPEVDNMIASKILSQQDTDIADDIAPESQPETSPVVSATETVPAADNEAEQIRFTPYESPLRMFKSYRYHPGYAQDVAGGFLSLTFSHQIDSEKPLCQHESAGATCSDAECPDQHFRDLNITGEKLLVQLGTANPGKTSDEKQKWNDGLRGVLKELRQKNIKDPNGIAVEIAKYRRQFLNDDSRVVNL